MIASENSMALFSPIPLASAPSLTPISTRLAHRRTPAIIPAKVSQAADLMYRVPNMMRVAAITPPITTEYCPAGGNFRARTVRACPSGITKRTVKKAFIPVM